MKVPISPETCPVWSDPLAHRTLFFLLSKERAGKVSLTPAYLHSQVTSIKHPEESLSDAMHLLVANNLIECDEKCFVDPFPCNTTTISINPDVLNTRYEKQTPCPEADRLMQCWDQHHASPPKRDQQRAAFRLMLERDSKVDDTITEENVAAVIRWLPTQVIPTTRDNAFPGWGKIITAPVRLRKHWSAKVKASATQGVWESYVADKSSQDKQNAAKSTLMQRAREAFNGFV